LFSVYAGFFIVVCILKACWQRVYFTNSNYFSIR